MHGEFVDLDGDRYYAIANVDAMPAFFISLVSNDDHWLFASSTGGLTAGRVSPENALFPYVPVDKVHESWPHTGSRTLLRVRNEQGTSLWEPFHGKHSDAARWSRNLYKNTLGNKLCFEEIHHDLGLRFRYRWMTSRRYGFVRECELINQGHGEVQVDLLDGLQNILPADTPLFTQTGFSNLVDAYKWTELDPPTGLGIMTLYSGITDRAEPRESLKATTVFCLGLNEPNILLSSAQIEAFRCAGALQPERHKRGIRAAYLVNSRFRLQAGEQQDWRIIANTRQTQKDVVALRLALRETETLNNEITRDVAAGSAHLAGILAAGDGFQDTAEEHVAVHHTANALFNILRGGMFHDQYRVPANDFAATIRHFNHRVHDRNQALLAGLPERVELDALRLEIEQCGDCQLQRLAGEYLPITFGRRHGDPSRPWNRFEIRLQDEYGNPLLGYAGNWRDIFQNWEALAFSFPEFIEPMIAKFVNASTMDGYNPYRITKDGIDWEGEEPDDPWSYIGYWGDHQIIYLLKLLELSNQFHPERLHKLLRESLFSYANVPYRIKPFAELLIDPKNTVRYDKSTARAIDERVARIGADGKLVLDEQQQAWQVNLLEKLIVPLLSKLGNLVVDGGIWLNTQRPEWNDANNALVGHGLSMVTLCYMRRYVMFLANLLTDEQNPFSLSSEVGQWLVETADVLARLRNRTDHSIADAGTRYRFMAELGQAAGRYRAAVYEHEGFSGRMDQPVAGIQRMLTDALQIIDLSIASNQRDDRLYNAYNLMHLGADELEIEPLYPMLEGQVAALSSRAISPKAAVAVLEALFDSAIYRPDQQTFMLYPDRALPSFLEKNRISAEQLADLPLIDQMLARGDERIIVRDAENCYRFSAEFANVTDLNATLDRVLADYGDKAEAARKPLAALYESVFNHKAFTGRSGTMFGFEGLGSVYWHMVAKLLLAVQENFFLALEQEDQQTCARLGSLYYRVREGLGFNKTPQEYGAFPTDPYSHTPGHSGAQQPGMTGQVKEEILTRFGELGVRVERGIARFEPALLRAQEFKRQPGSFRYLDVDGNWQHIELPENSLAFTWCQVPIIYRLDNRQPSSIMVVTSDGERHAAGTAALSDRWSTELFRRSGSIQRLELSFPASTLFTDRADH